MLRFPLDHIPPLNYNPSWASYSRKKIDVQNQHKHPFFKTDSGLIVYIIRLCVVARTDPRVHSPQPHWPPGLRPRPPLCGPGTLCATRSLVTIPYPAPASPRPLSLSTLFTLNTLTHFTHRGVRLMDCGESLVLFRPLARRK